MTGGRPEASPAHREEGESPGHSRNGGSCNPQFSIQYEHFSYGTLHNDLLSNQAYVLTGEARELCDSLDRPASEEINVIRLAWEDLAA
jgi:hypothetical protein